MSERWVVWSQISGNWFVVDHGDEEHCRAGVARRLRTAARYDVTDAVFVAAAVDVEASAARGPKREVPKKNAPIRDAVAELLRTTRRPWHGQGIARELDTGQAQAKEAINALERQGLVTIQVGLLPDDPPGPDRKYATWFDAANASEVVGSTKRTDEAVLAVLHGPGAWHIGRIARETRLDRPVVARSVERLAQAGRVNTSQVSSIGNVTKKKFVTLAEEVAR